MCFNQHNIITQGAFNVNSLRKIYMLLDKNSDWLWIQKCASISIISSITTGKRQNLRNLTKEVQQQGKLGYEVN